MLPGEAAPAAPNVLWLYEHSDATTTMKLQRSGRDLVFHAN